MLRKPILNGQARIEWEFPRNASLQSVMDIGVCAMPSCVRYDPDRLADKIRVSNDLGVLEIRRTIAGYILSTMSVKINGWGGGNMLASSLKVDLPLESASDHQPSTISFPYFHAWFQHILLHLDTFTCDNTIHQPKTQSTRKKAEIQGHAEMIHPSSWHPLSASTPSTS